MSTDDISAPTWLDPAWRAAAEEWVAARLAEHGLAVTGETEQTHARPWSTVLRVPTAAGPVWFKASASGTAYEAPLLTALAGWTPDQVLVPLAADTGRGWLLLPDGGTTLRAQQAGHTDLAHWERGLVEYGELQRRVESRADDMVALGVPDLRPAALPARLADLLDDEELLLVGRPDGLTRAQLDRLRADLPTYARWCADLASTGVAPSLQHDDLHDANLFVGNGHYRVFDWGDASVAHPFTTLLVSLRVVADRLQLPYGAPELLRLRDAYLEPWTAEHDRAGLAEACRLALRVGAVGRALAWQRALVNATPAAMQRFGGGPAGWLLELYQPTPLDAPD
ncbi:MAG TPA: phosphotransferase [Actinomycetes bacterium]